MQRHRLQTQALITVLALLLSLVSSSHAMAQNDGSPKSPRPSEANQSLAMLSSLSLSMNDMPLNSKEIYNEYVESNQPNHLLYDTFMQALESANPSSTLAKFTNGHVFSAVSFNDGVILGNFTYSFSMGADTLDIAEKTEKFLQNNGGTSLPEYSLAQESSRQAALKMVDDQGDSVYWLIATRDNFLIALFANGVSDDGTHKAFDAFVTTVMNKQPLNYKSQIFLPFVSTKDLTLTNEATHAASVHPEWRGPANSVGWAFNEPTAIPIPHYGAWFIGRNGSGQYFICAFPPSGYSSWNWWGNKRNVLLLEKRYLATNPSMWNPGCHYAVMTYP